MSDKSEIWIFLAHASEDKQQVRELYRKLQQEGYSPWLDEENLLPGQSWQEEIQKAIKRSDFFIACLSQQSITKTGYVHKEFRLALSYCAERPQDDIYLIPLKFDDCQVPNLRQESYGVALRDY
ncbi:MAG: toll/interleukin-1 receptor domain-containing protein [Acaryochloridaceae cyanobacterium CSU_3_4]|nr:toll/interleukin-1 receptor domain-containing protein [Acaryochloridaceae cyanobacterium CSU_3_4]